MPDEFVIDPSLLSLDAEAAARRPPSVLGPTVPDAASSSHDIAARSANSLNLIAGIPGDDEQADEGEDGEDDDPDAALYSQLSGLGGLGYGAFGAGDGDVDMGLGGMGVDLHGLGQMTGWAGGLDGEAQDDLDLPGPSARGRGRGRGRGRPRGSTAGARGAAASGSTRGRGRPRGSGRGKGRGRGTARGEAGSGGEDGAEEDRNGDDAGEEEGADEEDEEEEGDDADADVLRTIAGQVSRDAQSGQSSTTARQSRTAILRQKNEQDVPRRKAKGRTKKVHKPTHEVTLLLADANMAYMNGDYARATERFLEVIKNDQTVMAAWTSLASCAEQLGRLEDARTYRFGALHLEGEVDDWRDLAISYRADGFTEDAIYCLRKATSKDTKDIMSYWELADIYKVMGEEGVTKSLESFKRVLKLDPDSAHDFTLIMEFYNMYRSTKTQKRNGVAALRNAWRWHLDTFDGPRDVGPVRRKRRGGGRGVDDAADDDDDQDEDDDDEDDEDEEEEERPRLSNTMRMEHIIALADLLLEVDELEEALDVIKKGQRWLQGRYRHDEGEWAGTEMEDDREYDPPDYVRPDAAERAAKAKKAAARKSKKAAAAAAAAGLGDDADEVDQYGHGQQEGKEEEESDEPQQRKSFPLDANLRYRLALIRLRMGHDDEAQLHAERILALDAERYEPLFTQLGDEMVKREKWLIGAQLYGKLNEHANVNDSAERIYNLATCLHELYKLYPQDPARNQRRDAALEALEWVIKADEGNMNARLRLAHLYEDIGRRAEALDIATEVMRYRAANEPSTNRGAGERRARNTMGGAGLYLGLSSELGGHGPGQRAERSARQRLERSIMEDQTKQQMALFWSQAQQLEESIGQGKAAAIEHFMQVAGSMVETFRLAGRNFGKNRGVTRVRVNVAKKQDASDSISSEARDLQDRLVRELGFENDEPEQETADDGSGPTFVTKRQTEFYGINAEEWLGLIIKYCIILTHKNEGRLALEILEHTIWANIFFNYRSEVAFRMAIITCALRMRHYPRIVQNCRRLAQMHQFSSEPFLLMLACMQGGGIKAQISYQVTTLQKFILRELRLYEAAAAGGRFHYSVKDRRWAEEKQVGLSENLGDDPGDVEEDEDDEDEEDEDDDDDDGLGTGKKKGKGRGKSKKGKKKADKAWARGKRFEIEYGTGTGAGIGSGTNAEEMDVEMQAAEHEADARRESMRALQAGDIEIDGVSEMGEGWDDLTGPMPIKPTTESPMWNFMYGQMMLTARSHHTSLFYLSRAYEINPYDPLLCLLIAQSFFIRSQNRQTDNRNQATAQGLAFLQRYRKLSPQDAESIEEVEYNFGRSFHGLGIPHLAVKHYELVLSSVKRRMQEAVEDRDKPLLDVDMEQLDDDGNARIPPDELIRRSSLAYEAGLNLMLIYGASGSPDLVRERSKWLAI